jgi:hypothetical protein
MTRKTMSWSLLLMLTVVAFAYAEQTTPDPRLQQKITYEAKHKPIKLILADLSKMTGVTLKAGASEQDWQVRDRRMNIFVKDLPLLVFMNSMARVMDFTWDKNIRVDPPTYRVYMDRRRLAAAEAEKTKADQEFRRRMMEQRQKLVDYVRNLPNYTPEDLKQLKEENPYLYLMHERGTDRLMKALLDEVPGYEEHFVNYDRILHPPANILSDSTLDLLLESAKKGMWFPDELKDMDVDKLRTGRVDLYTPTPELVRGDMGWCFGGIGGAVDDQGFFIQSMQDCEAPYGNFRSKAEIEAAETKTSFHDVLESRGPLLEQARREDIRAQEEMEGCEPVTEHPDEPWLHTKVELALDKDDPDSLQNALQSMAKASGYNIVSDSFNLTNIVGSMSGSEQETGKALATICDNYGYNWNRHGSILEFRDRNWFKRRRTQIPDEWMDRWKKNFKANGQAVLSDIAQMASLPFEQMDENVAADPVFKASEMFVWTLRNGRGLLSVYNSFTASQRKALMNGGVGFGTLTPEQQAVAIETFQPMDTCEWDKPRFWEDPTESLTFKGEWSKTEEGEKAFILSCTGNNKKLWYGHMVALRKYVEPPKPKEEAEKKSGS